MVRDAAARIVRIDTKGSGEADFTVLIGNITYSPYGPLTGAQFGDGHSLSIAYDTAYRATNLSRTHASGSALMNVGFSYDANGDILALNDNVRPERSQTFTYDAVSRLKTASGGYGDIGCDYNLGGDRPQRTFNDGTTTEIEDYTYNASFRLDNVSSTLDGIRSFTYEASGQVATDARSGEIYAYTNNNRGRPVLVTKDGVEVASYTYDDDEQRVVKSLPDGTLVHYAYDSERRLISETDGNTGEMIREYIWLGLTPNAVIAANDNGPCVEQARIDELTALIAGKTTRITNNQARITNLNTRITDKTARIVANQARIVTIETRVANLEAAIATRQARIVTLTTRIGELQSQITTHQTRIGVLGTRNTELATQITTHQTRIGVLETRNTELATQITAHQTRIGELQTR